MNLWVEPPAQHFTHDQEADLKKVLELDRKLILSPLNGYQDLLLDNEACIQATHSKYRLTRWALFQLCQLLCPSMYGFVTDLAGVEREKDSNREDYSFETAVKTINYMVKLRFHSKLQNRVALVDTIRQTIDGFVSSAYRWLPNYELYDRTNEAMSACSDCVFLEAQLVGRWTLIRYIHTAPHLRVVSDAGIADPFFIGYHFSNNEVGKASVRAANMLYRKFSKSAAISAVNVNETTLRHTGLKFEARFNDMIRNLFNRPMDAAKHAESIQRMQTLMLGLGSRNVRSEEKAMDELAAKVARRGLPVNVAQTAVTNAAYQGSYDEVPIEPVLFRPKDRSVYDLYNALGRCARSLPINLREQSEQVAFSILMGKINFDTQSRSQHG